MNEVVVGIDVGSSAVKAPAFDRAGRPVQKVRRPLTTHCGGLKFLWLRRDRSSLFQRLDSPGAVFSPLSSFVLHQLTGGRPAAVDESIAGRTLLVDIATRRWESELMALFEMPPHLLPQIVAVCRRHGGFVFGGRTIPIECCIGDQKAALAALGGLQQGRCLLSLGTSGGVLVDTGRTPTPAPGLLLSVARSSATEVSYAAEGTINAVGSLFEWFEAEQQISGAAVRWDRLAADASDGWQMIPNMFGIAAPYCRETAPTVFAGEGLRLLPPVWLRAGMEAIALLIADIVDRVQIGRAHV